MDAFAWSVNWLQDIFPEVAERLGVGRGRLARIGYGVMRKRRDASLRAADKNVVLGAVMQRDVERLKVPASRIVQIPNWANGEAIKPSARAQNALRADWDLDDAFVVAHAGNLVRTHDA